MAEDKEPQYSKPASQVDLEERLANGNRSDKVLSTADNFVQPEEDSEAARDMGVEGNDLDDYLNVDPIYKNYANDTEAPARAEEGAEADLEAVVYEEAVVGAEGVIDNDEHDKLKEEKKAEAAKSKASSSDSTKAAKKTTTSSSGSSES